MGAKCCSGEEVKGGQADAVQQHPTGAAVPEAEEAVKLSNAAQAAKTNKAETHEPKKVVKEWQVKLTKSERVRLGVDVDLNEGTTLIIDTVNPGLMEEWNKANPDEVVKPGDRICSVNGTSGDAMKMTEVCKRDTVLVMIIQRLG